MDFYKQLDFIMKQDFGNRGLLSSLPENPAEEAANTLRYAKRVIILTGFPVRLQDGSFIGETDGPSGTANLAATLIAIGCRVDVVTDSASYDLLHSALLYRAPKATLTLLPSGNTDAFIKNFISTIEPTHFISLECPGKACDGHYHNMYGAIIDDIVTDSALFLSEAHLSGAVTISIGDGGNEMGMGTYRKEIIDCVSSGELICAKESSDIVLASGVSNWWGWGISAILSCILNRNFLPSAAEETELLKRVVAAGGVDGCTAQNELTVDHLSLDTHLSVLEKVYALTSECLLKETTKKHPLQRFY